MRTIWKYPLPFPPKDMFVLNVPRGAWFIRVEIQHGQPCLWVFVPDTEAPKTARNFAVIGTGHPAPDSLDGYYVGSFHLMDGNFVGHLFTDWPDPSDTALIDGCQHEWNTAVVDDLGTEATWCVKCAAPLLNDGCGDQTSY